jgi:hypothetical protein
MLMAPSAPPHTLLLTRKSSEFTSNLMALLQAAGFTRILRGAPRGHQMLDDGAVSAEYSDEASESDESHCMLRLLQEVRVIAAKCVRFSDHSSPRGLAGFPEPSVAGCHSDITDVAM